METHRTEQRSSSAPPAGSGWQREVHEAQAHAAYNIAGVARARVPHQGNAPCADCRVAAGQLHVPGCDEEVCPVCGGAVVTCGCPYGAR